MSLVVPICIQPKHRGSVLTDEERLPRYMFHTNFLYLNIRRQLLVRILFCGQGMPLVHGGNLASFCRFNIKLNGIYLGRCYRSCSSCRIKKVARSIRSDDWECELATKSRVWSKRTSLNARKDSSAPIASNYFLN